MTSLRHFQALPLLVGAVAVFSSPAEARAGSLWLSEANNQQGMYADHRARNVGDPLTIVVQESTVSTKAQEIKTYDAAQNGFGVFVSGLLNQFLTAGAEAAKIATGIRTPVAAAAATGNATVAAPALTAASAFSNVTIPTLDLASKSDYNGGGATTLRLSVSNRTTVTVVDTLPNGNLVIEGTKIIHVGSETQYGYMRGIVRQTDVQRDNTVLSTDIADAKVEFVSEGELTDAEKKGWLLRFYDNVKPF